MVLLRSISKLSRIEDTIQGVLTRGQCRRLQSNLPTDNSVSQIPFRVIDTFSKLHDVVVVPLPVCASPFHKEAQNGRIGCPNKSEFIVQVVNLWEIDVLSQVDSLGECKRRRTIWVLRLMHRLKKTMKVGIVALPS